MGSDSAWMLSMAVEWATSLCRFIDLLRLSAAAPTLSSLSLSLSSCTMAALMSPASPSSGASSKVVWDFFSFLKNKWLNLWELRGILVGLPIFPSAPDLGCVWPAANCNPWSWSSPALYSPAVSSSPVRCTCPLPSRCLPGGVLWSPDLCMWVTFSVVPPLRPSRRNCKSFACRTEKKFRRITFLLYVLPLRSYFWCITTLLGNKLFMITSLTFLLLHW